MKETRQEGQTISAPASTAAGNVAGSTEETQTCKKDQNMQKQI